MTQAAGCIDDEVSLTLWARNAQAIGQLRQADGRKRADVQSFHGMFLGQQMKGRVMVWV